MMLNTSGNALWKKKHASVQAQVVDPKNQLKRRNQRKENYKSAGIHRLSVKFV
jgi:hypothetical protein